MSTVQQSTFIIDREDRAEAPKTIIREGLRIGRLPDSDIWLNHPKVSRLHAGINRIEGYFYLINLSASSATTLNGRVIPFNAAEALTDGDEIQIGPFFLLIQQTDEKLRIRVVLQFALSVGERTPLYKAESYQKQLASESRVTGSLLAPTARLDSSVAREALTRMGHASELVNAIKIFWDKRTREKAGRPSPLHPQAPPRLGKVRFNWIPTRDLIRPWPFAIFIWGVIIVAALSTLAAFANKNAFAPQAISDSHTRKTLALTPPIARQPNGGACTSCHSFRVSIANREKMSANCAACHHMESFVADITLAHRAAGVTCTHCHTEHRGPAFRPVNAALESCAKCHNDQNKNLYNGKSVHTAHGGTYGYPVENGIWIWSGLDVEELAAKPEIAALLKQNGVTPGQTQQWRSVQFHALHLYRVRVVAGMNGIKPDGVNEVLSCSSCHKAGYTGANVDRTNPRTTCARCHNTQIFNSISGATKGAETVSCTSCHVQHIKDTHWAPSLLVRSSQDAVARKLE